MEVKNSVCLFIRKQDHVVTWTRTVNEFNLGNGFYSVNEFSSVNIFSSGNFCKGSLWFNGTNTWILVAVLSTYVSIMLKCIRMQNLIIIYCAVQDLLGFS